MNFNGIFIDGMFNLYCGNLKFDVFLILYIKFNIGDNILNILFYAYAIGIYSNFVIDFYIDSVILHIFGDICLFGNIDSIILH